LPAGGHLELYFGEIFHLVGVIGNNNSWTAFGRKRSLAVRKGQQKYLVGLQG